MEKELLKRFVDLGLSTRGIAIRTSTSQTNVRHWLKKHDLKTQKQLGRSRTNMYFCSRCEMQKTPTDFYIKPSLAKKGRTHNYCKDCDRAQVTERQRRFKAECVEYMGGKCEACSYNRCLAGLDFHHLDPREKEFSIATVTSLRLNESVKRELDKCVLLCATCHREAHAGLLVPTDDGWEHLGDQVGLEPTRSDLHQLRE